MKRGACKKIRGLNFSYAGPEAVTLHGIPRTSKAEELQKNTPAYTGVFFSSQMCTRHYRAARLFVDTKYRVVAEGYVMVFR